MKDEEMAEEYVKKEGFKFGMFGELDNITSSEANKEIKQAFLAGLKAGRPQWHYVKSKEDLPKDNSEYLLLLEHGIRAFGYYNGKFWESWNGDLSWQEVKAYYDVPVPDEDKLNDKKE